MADESSDEGDIFITQNTFSHSAILPDFDVLFDILSGGRELEAVEEETEQSTVDEVKSLRSISIVSDSELQKKNEDRIPQGTKTNTAWAVRTWEDWAQIRNQRSKTANDMYTFVEPNVLQVGSDSELNYWLAKFVVEVRKKNSIGEPYPPNTLYQLSCGIQRHFRENGRPELNLFESPCFKKFQDSLDGEMKRLTGMGYGSVVKEAEAFTEDQEEKLWNLKLLGDHSPQVLLNTMVFLIGKNFSLRSGKEHRSLRFDQLTLVKETEKEPEKLVYSSFGERNYQGGLKHRSIKGKKVKYYANNDVPQRCLVNLYKKYVAKCPKLVNGSFYLSPKKKLKETDEEWFTSNPVGHNPLGQTVCRLCKEAGIDGHYTNHSLRVTTSTRGLLKGVPPKYIMERTGHRDVRSLQKYERPDQKTKVAICKAFECGSGFFKEEQATVQVKTERKSEVDRDTTDGNPKKKVCYESEPATGFQLNNCTFSFN